MVRAISIPWRELAAHRVQRGGLSGHQRHVLPAGPSSAMTDLGSGPRHPAVEQDPASTSLNSGNVCSPCDTPQLGHSSTQATPRHQQTPLQPPQLGHSSSSLRFRLRRRASQRTARQDHWLAEPFSPRGPSGPTRRDSRPPPFSCRAMPQLRWTPSRGPFATRSWGQATPRCVRSCPRQAVLDPPARLQRGAGSRVP
jgi:hypothetical protein